MEVFRTFRKVKCLLRAATFAIFLANLQGAWAQTAYRWTNGAGNTNTEWTTSTNWKKYTGTIQYDSDGNAKMFDVVNDTTHWTDLETDKYPGKNTSTDYVIISGDYTVTLKTNITISKLYIDIDSNGNNQTVTLNTGTYTLTASDNIFTGCYQGSGGSTNTFNSSFTIDGSGTVTVGTFDFPNYKTHTITINSKATFKITGLFFGNSSNGGTLNVKGNGTLYVPASGADLNFGDCVITYDPNLTIKPYGNPTYYSVTLNNISNLPGSGASVTITRNTDGDHNVKYPYIVKEASNGAAFSFNGIQLPTTTPSATLYLSIGTSAAEINYGKNFPITASGTIDAGDGFTIEIYTPDKARILSTVSWYKSKTAWTGNTDTDWSNNANWTLADPDSSLADNLKSADLVINAVPNKPVISSGDWEVKSLEITANASVTMEGGTLSTNKITLSTDTSKFYGKTTDATGNIKGGTVKLINSDSTSPTLSSSADNFSFKNLSIGENATFTMPFDMSLEELTVNTGAAFNQTSSKLSVNKIEATGTGKFNSTGGTVELKNSETTLPTLVGSKDNFSIKNLSIAENASFTMPFDMSLEQLTVNTDASFNQSSGKMSVNKIEVTGTGKFNSNSIEGTVELVNSGDTEATLVGAADNFSIKKLSIAESAKFTMPFEMSLGMLIINSGASFSKGGKTLNLGWLEVQTANYSNPPLTGDARNITLTDAFEADSIIILLRDGNIIAKNTLSARNDFIIGGANYNYAIIKYDMFRKRPDYWVPSYTDIELDFSGRRDENSTFKLSTNETDTSKKGEIRAGTGSEGKGNFYINGANLEGTSSGGNIIAIPQNDSAEKFCAYSVFSNIKNITVACLDGDVTGEKSQIPAGGGSIDDSCKNFDKEPFYITKAETVFDNKIKITMSRETRNTQGELNDSKIINAVKVSDGNCFTSTYVPPKDDGTPDLHPIEFYIETDKTSWNMDATGIMDPATVKDICKYTNSKSDYRSVVPYLTIPQTADYGYTLTDKWGKHIELYNPYTGTEDGTDKTPTWSGQVDTVWEKPKNWYNIHKDKTLKQALQENDITLKPTTNSPVISTAADSVESWQVKSMTIATGASLTIENVGMLKTESFTNNGTFTQTGGMLQLTKLTGTSAKIKSVTDETQPIKNLELLPGTDLTLESDIYITNLIMEDNTTITRGIAPTIHQLTATNVITYANTGTLILTEDYSAKNIYFVSGTVNIANPINAENILAYGGTINLTAAASSLKAKKDFIIIGEKYDLSLFKYEHFAKRPAGWAGVNIPLDDFGKLPDGGTVPNFSAKITVFPGASITAGSDALPNSGVTGNLYINGTELSGTGEWFISIPQNDSPANFCAEAINSTITNCTVKCDADNSTDGSKSQIPTEEIKENMLSGCRNFDKEDFAISKAYTVSDNRIYLEFDSKNRPLRNNNGELADSNRLKLINIGTFTGGTFGSITAAYNSKTGSDLPAANPNEIYIVADTTWNTDATGTYVGSGKYTDSSGHFKRVKPSLYIPQYQFDYDDNYNEIVLCGYLLTDKWGKRLKNYSFNPDDYSDLSFTAVADGIPESEKVPRIPPAYGAVLSSVGGNKIAVTFTKPIVTDSNKISYYTADYRPDGTPYNVERVTITQPMSQLFPRCFELFSIDSAGNPVTSDLQIDKNQSAQIEDAASGYCILTMQLTRNVTLNDIQNLYIRLIQPKGDDGNPLYPDTMYDHITEQKGTRVSFVQQTNEEHSEDGQNYMILKTAHTMSDFAIGAVTPSYAYISNLNTNDDDDKDFFKNLYGNGNAAVHDFSKAQKNYGTLPYGQEISIVSKVNLGSDSKSEGDYPPALKLFITDAVDSDTIFPVLNTKFNKSAYAWLPQSSEVLLKDFQSYTDKLNSHFWAAQSELIKKTPANGFIFTIPKESAVQMKPGSQTNFFYLLCDASGAYLPHYFDPICDYENNTYDLSQSVKSPLFVFNLSNNADLFSLSPWFITLKSITEQRGGVTILNNVINAAVGEKTVLKVNMPSSGNLDIMIMTIDGNIVKYLAHGNASAGEHFYYWDGRNNSGSEVARGMYFVIIKAPGIDENRKVMVVK